MKIEKTYPLYVFDFDGTLIDTREDIARAFEVMMGEFGFEIPTHDQVKAAIGGGAKKAVRKLTGLPDEEIAPCFERFIELYGEMCADNTTIYEGGLALLNRLRAQGALLAVITMKARIPTVRIIEKHKLDMFDDVVAYDDIQKRKPDPDCMYKLLEKHGLAPADALMIGDTTTDMRFANNAGVDACAVTYGYGKTEDILAENPKYVLDSLLDF